MSTLYVKARVGGKDHFIKFEIEDPDAKSLVAKAAGARPSQVSNMTTHKGSSPPSWFRSAASTASHSVSLVVS